MTWLSEQQWLNFLVPDFFEHDLVYQTNLPDACLIFRICVTYGAYEIKLLDRERRILTELVSSLWICRTVCARELTYWNPEKVNSPSSALAAVYCQSHDRETCHDMIFFVNFIVVEIFVIAYQSFQILAHTVVGVD